MTILASKGRFRQCIDQDMVVRHVRVLRMSVMWLVSILVLIFPFLNVEQQPR